MDNSIRLMENGAMAEKRDSYVAQAIERLHVLKSYLTAHIKDEQPPCGGCTRLLADIQADLRSALAESEPVEPRAGKQPGVVRCHCPACGAYAYPPGSLCCDCREHQRIAEEIRRTKRRNEAFGRIW